MELALLFGILFVALAMGVPVAFCLLAATVGTALYMGTPMIAIAQQMGSDITSIALLAIPLFIFTGELMMKGGLSDRMIALASSRCCQANANKSPVMAAASRCRLG